jgi:hypothetical protein
MVYKKQLLASTAMVSMLWSDGRYDHAFINAFVLSILSKQLSPHQ